MVFRGFFAPLRRLKEIVYLSSDARNRELHVSMDTEQLSLSELNEGMYTTGYSYLDH